MTDRDTFTRAMESLMHVTLAGFGGALVGLSFARRRGVAGGSAAAQITARRVGAPYVDHDLPVTWAVTCLTFAGIVEFSTLISPTSLFLDWCEGRSNDELRGNKEPVVDADEVTPGGSTGVPFATKIEQRFVKEADVWAGFESVGDYTLGGALAGAVFKGAVIRTKAGTRLAAAGMGRGGPPVPRTASIVAGLVPGAALGFLAGMANFGINRLQQLAEKELGENCEEMDKEIGDDVDRAEGTEEAEAERLSKKEVEQQIEELQNRNSSRQDGRNKK